MQIRIELDGDLRTILEAMAESRRYCPSLMLPWSPMLAGVGTFTAVQELRDDAPVVLFFGLTRVVEVGVEREFRPWEAATLIAKKEKTVCHVPRTC